jgi:hypothetical protein
LGMSAGHPQEPPWGGPADIPNQTLGGSAGPTETAMGGSAGPTWGGPADPRTDQDRTTTTTTDHSGDVLRTAVTAPRASRAAQDPFPSEESSTRPPMRPRPPDNRPHNRPVVRPAWRHDLESRTCPPADSPGRAAYAAAKARLTAQRASTCPSVPHPDPAWDALVAATGPLSPLEVPSNG